ncbi:MAG: hypothetical protein KAV87_56600 [Desulfobacteraceae bacterium]|nr:hypothetical protein [Desulfobacteraceae bacterium]
MGAFKKVKEIIVEVLSVNEKDVSREASFIDDFYADSIVIFELVLTHLLQLKPNIEARVKTNSL